MRLSVDTMKLKWLVAIFFLPCASLLAKETTAASSGKWWGVAISPSVTNDVTDTQGAPITDIPRLKPLNKHQRRLVTKHPGVLNAITTAVAMAVQECKYQFKDRRWNCSTTKKTTGSTSLFGKILDIGCRETAFLYAITTAAVTHAVARACSEKTIATCSCDSRNLGPSGEDWEWGGCSDNAAFGHRFARKFVDAGETDQGRDLRCAMNLHNNEAGRRTVISEMKRDCKCHGMSGSCTIKTCWMTLPDFHTVGTLLKDRFDGATRIVSTNNGNPSGKRKENFVPENESHKQPTSVDLVYYENSPDFCNKNGRYGIPGTVGRECNNTSLGVDGCDLMCCGRGYTSSIITVKSNCSCTFKWCCEVKCRECTTRKLIHRCL